MANKDRNKRAARQARQEERARVEAAQAASAVPTDDKSKSKGLAKSEAKKPEKKADAAKKTGFIAKVRGYFGDVRSEMRRVVWPSKDELKSYSVAIIAMLIVFGVVIWLVDSGIVALLVGYTGLRG